MTNLFDVRRTMTYRLPLKDATAVLALPTDLTRQEVARLHAFLLTLVLEDETADVDAS